jgi:RHS repeat-associated protein
VRQLVDESGTLTLAQSYQPYGEPLNTAGSSPSNYAFAGEWRDASGLDYLRTRYYAPWQGRFLTKDAWPGDYARPLTLNRWNYVVSNPVNLTDPTGMFPDYCHVYPNRMEYEDCVRNTYHVDRPWKYENYLATRMNSKDCLYEGPVPYSTVGYLEGASGLFAVLSVGAEVVYDFATMESAKFTYHGLGITTGLGGGFNYYAGMVTHGFNSNRSIGDYSGNSVSVNAGIQANLLPFVGVSTGVMGFASLPSSLPVPPIGGVAWYVGGSVGVDLPLIFGPDLGGGLVNYVIIESRRKGYWHFDSSGFKRVDRTSIIHAISSGVDSPWDLPNPIIRQNIIDPLLLNMIEAYEALNNADKY